MSNFPVLPAVGAGAVAFGVGDLATAAATGSSAGGTQALLAGGAAAIGVGTLTAMMSGSTGARNPAASTPPAGASGSMTPDGQAVANQPRPPIAYPPPPSSYPGAQLGQRPDMPIVAQASGYPGPGYPNGPFDPQRMPAVPGSYPIPAGYPQPAVYPQPAGAPANPVYQMRPDVPPIVRAPLGTQNDAAVLGEQAAAESAIAAQAQLAAARGGVLESDSEGIPRSMGELHDELHKEDENTSMLQKKLNSQNQEWGKLIAHRESPSAGHDLEQKISNLESQIEDTQNRIGESFLRQQQLHQAISQKNGNTHAILGMNEAKRKIDRSEINEEIRQTDTELEALRNSSIGLNPNDKKTIKQLEKKMQEVQIRKNGLMKKAELSDQLHEKDLEIGRLRQDALTLNPSTQKERLNTLKTKIEQGQASREKMIKDYNAASRIGDYAETRVAPKPAAEPARTENSDVHVR